MADAVWPVGLPPPRLQPFSESLKSQVVRTAMDTGPAKVRRRQSAPIREFTVEIKITGEQLAVIFEPFFLDSLKGGSLTFSMTNPRTGVVDEYRFVSPPAYKPLGVVQLGTDEEGKEYWAVTFTLEQLPTAVEIVAAPSPGANRPTGWWSESDSSEPAGAADDQADDDGFSALVIPDGYAPYGGPVAPWGDWGDEDEPAANQDEDGSAGRVDEGWSSPGDPVPGGPGGVIGGSVGTGI
jgi:hypothetical protein